MPTVERNIRVEMPDGVVLAADIHHPDGTGPFPTLLMRTCYGKAIIAQYFGVSAYVDAGYRVVVQDCRGSGGSDGEQDHFAESADGRVTADWIATQPWFDGNLGTWGGSYMGFTQWALAVTRPPYLKAMHISLTNARGGQSWFPGGSFALDIALPWMVGQVETKAKASADEDVEFDIAAVIVPDPERTQRLADAMNHLPLRDVDDFATGQRVVWWERWMAHPSAEDPFWKPLDFSDALDLAVPILFTDGWHDYATVNIVRDFQQRQAAGLSSRLVVGPGTHFGTGVDDAAEAIRWFDHHLKGIDRDLPTTSASVFVMPDVGWRDLQEWPPATDALTWYLQEEGSLDGSPSSGSAVTSYVYDPADPTPSVGGPSLRMDQCGPVDNRDLEAREDVLTFTTDPLTEPLLIIGNVQTRLFLTSDVDNLDVYVRLCDVLPTGESINVTETLQRLTPMDVVRDAEGVFEIALELRPVAQQFAAGHRIRLQLSGGAHPMFARNTCSGEPLADAVTLVKAHNAVLHTERYPSSVTLPVPA